MAPKRERESAEIGAMSRRVFRALVRRAGDGDVEALRELVALQDQLRDAITDAGRELHAFGFSFTYLAAETGVTRQAARKRYSSPRCPHGRTVASRVANPCPGTFPECSVRSGS